MIIEPQGEWILLEKLDAPESGTIVIPSRYQPRPDRGTVLATGDGRRTSEGHVEPPAVMPGDTVAYQKLAGHDFKIDGTRLLLIKEDDILAVLA